MSEKVEVKATFVSISIKNKTVLQFELSPACEKLLPQLTALANKFVFLTITPDQQPLFEEDEVQEAAEMIEEIKEEAEVEGQTVIMDFIGEEGEEELPDFIDEDAEEYENELIDDLIDDESDMEAVDEDN